MTGPVTIVPYNLEWPHIYARERKRIMEAAGPRLLATEHIGSTAVPGLGGKGIVDIMAGVADAAAADACLPLVAPLGYDHVTPQPGDTEWFYCLGHGAVPGAQFHLHLMKYATETWRRYFLFRDFLRTHPDTAAEYYRLKLELAKKYRDDRVSYTVGKSDYINSIVARAESGQ